MKSLRKTRDNRRDMFLGLAASVSAQLKDNYGELFSEGHISQSVIAERLGINRSAINRRLAGASNMRLETLSDLCWALGRSVRIEIFDPNEMRLNEKVVRSENLDVQNETIRQVSISKLKPGQVIGVSDAASSPKRKASYIKSQSTRLQEGAL